MKPFAFQRPQTLADASQLSVATGAMSIAGGTNLLDLMKLQVEVPASWIGLPIVWPFLALLWSSPYVTGLPGHFVRRFSGDSRLKEKLACEFS